jgi:hypothetical protein
MKDQVTRVELGPVREVGVVGLGADTGTVVATGAGFTTGLVLGIVLGGGAVLLYSYFERDRREGVYRRAGYSGY